MIKKTTGLAERVRARLVRVAHDDQGSVSAEAAVLTAVFIGLAVIIGKVFGHAITVEAGKIANQIMAQ